MTTSDLIASGREAMARNDWAEAFELLARADADGGLDPKALEDLAVSAWWTGQPDECIAVRERAFGGYAGTDTTRAGVVALELAEDHFHKGALAMGKGWLKRASDLLGTDGDTIERPGRANHGRSSSRGSPNRQRSCRSRWAEPRSGGSQL